MLCCTVLCCTVLCCAVLKRAGSWHACVNWVVGVLVKQLRRCLRMLDALESLDDVRSVSSNLEADAEAMEVALA